MKNVKKLFSLRALFSSNDKDLKSEALFFTLEHSHCKSGCVFSILQLWLFFCRLEKHEEKNDSDMKKEVVRAESGTDGDGFCERKDGYLSV